MIYEIVDTTDEEAYWNLAFFTDKDQALAAADRHPADWNSDGCIVCHAKLEVRECKIGWHPCEYKTIKKVEWGNVYDDDLDDNIWVIKNETI